MAQLIIENVSKRYGETLALNQVSLAVESGELFGLIGPDGAGKTTLIRSICTLLIPDSGRITVAGLDTHLEMAAIRSRIGYMPQRFSLYQDLSVSQNLQFFADLFQVPPKERPQRLEQLYHFSRLGDFKNRLAGNLSGGMKQKLALSCALIHTPEILVLDEPTFGVDPVSRQEFWEILHDIRAGGTTIFVSTAYMDEADQCDRIALFLEGNVATLGSPDDVKGQYPFPLYRLNAPDLRQLKTFLSQQRGVTGIQLFGDALHVSFSTEPTTDTWESWAREPQFQGMRWQKQNPSIEDVFLAHMQEDDQT